MTGEDERCQQLAIPSLRPLIVCVHATHRAVEPARRMLNVAPVEFSQRHLIDEGLLACHGESGHALPRLLKALRDAEQWQPAAILTTCSLYTPHLPTARGAISTPIVGVDEALIDGAARTGGSLALVGSLSASIDLSAQQILERSRTMHWPTTIVERRVVPVDTCDTSDGARRLADELRGLSREVERVVVVQLSLSPVADYLSADEQGRILTSSSTALAHLRALLKEHKP